METIVWALSSGEDRPEIIEDVVRAAKEKNALVIGLFIIDPKVADVVFSRVSGAGFLGGKVSQNLHAAILREYKDRAHRRLKQFEECIQSHGIRAESALRRGEFAESCLVLVKERAASLLILGELSKYSFYQLLSGQATVQNLEKHAGCPIRIISQ